MTLTTKTNNAEGGTNGVTVTVANSGGASGNAFDNTSGMVFSNTHAQGTLSFEGVSSSLSHIGGWDMSLGVATPPFGTGGASYYVLTGFTFGCYLAEAVATGVVGGVAGHEFRMKLTVSGGNLGLVLHDLNTSTAVATFTSIPPFDTWFRFEWDLYVGSPTAASGRIVVRYYATAASTTATETVDVTATVGNFLVAAPGAGSLFYGKDTLGAGTTKSIWIDDLSWGAGAIPTTQVSQAIAEVAELPTTVNLNVSQVILEASYEESVQLTQILAEIAYTESAIFNPPRNLPGVGAGRPHLVRGTRGFVGAENKVKR